MTATFGHTIVQHSGFGYGGDTTFDGGLETRAVSKADATKVAHAGGVVFASYLAAEEYAMTEQYQPDGHFLIPAAPGTFAAVKVDGLAVYVPATMPEDVIA